MIDELGWSRILADQIHRLLLMEELRRLEELTSHPRGVAYLPDWVGREAARTGNVDAPRERYERLLLRRSAVISELGWFA